MVLEASSCRTGAVSRLGGRAGRRLPHADRRWRAPAASCSGTSRQPTLRALRPREPAAARSPRCALLAASVADDACSRRRCSATPRRPPRTSCSTAPPTPTPCSVRRAAVKALDDRTRPLPRAATGAANDEAPRHSTPSARSRLVAPGRCRCCSRRCGCCCSRAWACRNLLCGRAARASCCRACCTRFLGPGHAPARPRPVIAALHRRRAVGHRRVQHRGRAHRAEPCGPAAAGLGDGAPGADRPDRDRAAGHRSSPPRRARCRAWSTTSAARSSCTRSTATTRPRWPREIKQRYERPLKEIFE